MVPKIITDTTVTAFIDGSHLTANESHPNFKQLRTAALNNDWETFSNLLDVEKRIADWSDGRFTIVGDVVTYDGMAMPEDLQGRIVEFFQADAPFEYLLKFYEKLMQNPSMRSVSQLYSFLSHKNIPIGPEGNFYAYKAVQSDWYSITADQSTGERTFNGIGETPSMPRNQVNDDPSVGCSYGYHVGSLEYAVSFGGEGSRLLICSINPANVVSVPYDCQFQKLRCSEYTVVSEYTGPLPSIAYSELDEDSSTDEEDLESIELLEEIEQLISYQERLGQLIDSMEDAECDSELIECLADQLLDMEGDIMALEKRYNEMKNN